MGNIRPLFVKRIAKRVVDKYGEAVPKDFSEIKKFLEQVLDIPSKRLRNFIAGYVARLVRQRAS